MKKLIGLLITAILLTSCGALNVQKRKYQRGWSYGAKINKKEEKREGKTIPFEPIEVKAENLKQVPKEENTQKPNEPEHCDTIIKNSGDIVLGQVLGIGENYVGIKKCNSEKRRKFKDIKMSEISSIRYANGAMEDPNERPKISHKAKSGRVVLIIFGVLFILASIISFVLAGWSSAFLAIGFVLLAISAMFFLLGVRLIKRVNALKMQIKKYKEDRGLTV